MGVLYKWFHQLHITSNVYLKLRLFKAVVLPNITYGCEVWGTHLLKSDPNKPFGNEVDKTCSAFFRNLLGVKSATPMWCLYRELGMYPLQSWCFQQIIRFVDKLRSMPSHCLARLAMQDCVADYVDKGHDNWFATVSDFCSRLGVPCRVSADSGLPAMSEKSSMARLHSVYYSVFRDAPVGSKVHKYHHWFASQLPSKGSKRWYAQPYLFTGMASTKATVLARFRLGSHHLAVETGGWGRQSVPYQERVCTLCSADGTNCIQDEHHVLLDCPHFAGLRGQLPEVFDSEHGHSVWTLFNAGFGYGLAWYLKQTGLVFAPTAATNHPPDTGELTVNYS